MTAPLVVVDADVLGRRRTGDETYVRNLLRELAPLAGPAGIKIAAVTRRPDLVPEGIEAVELRSRSQELRMAYALPRLLRERGAALLHTQYALPLRCPCPAVVTIHDLSFERDPGLMGWWHRKVFRVTVPRAARAAACVLTVSERSKRDVVELYGLTPTKIVVTPNGVDPVFRPGEPGTFDYVLSVGAIHPRKNQAAALAAAREVGFPLVVAGPEKDAATARLLRENGASLRGYVPVDELAALYRGAACLVQASRYEGFGLPVLEAMASGTPVVTVPEEALLEVVGNAAVIVDDDAGLADGIRRALDERERLVRAGLERARAFSWRTSAESTLRVYLETLAR
jgi:glycosyltransferase involved in cell wall biosynthesis